MSRLNDPELVRKEYESEAGLEARRAVYRSAEGPDATGMVFDAVAEIDPRRVLEVGCGMGQLAERMHNGLEAEVVAIDQSERMVELTRARGVDARLGDAQELRFDDGEFDCVVAAWMLYHVPDVGRALDEIVRVLSSKGRLVAATNYPDHLVELFEFVGSARLAAGTFNGENAEHLLRTRFANVERRDATGTVTFADRDAVRAYVEPSVALYEGIDWVPELDAPLVVRRRPVVFVADR